MSDVDDQVRGALKRTQAESDAARADRLAQHADGARNALEQALNDNVNVICTGYCYGGSPEIDLTEILDDLALKGYILVCNDCTCPSGFGQVADPKCPRHGERKAKHTITGPAEVPGNKHDQECLRRRGRPGCRFLCTCDLSDAQVIESERRLREAGDAG